MVAAAFEGIETHETGGVHCRCGGARERYEVVESIDQRENVGKEEEWQSRREEIVGVM